MNKLIFTLLAALAICPVANARKVNGSVTCGKEKLSKVIVTDGKNFSTTDKKGRFTLEVDDNADFVLVITPSGYTAPFDGGTPEFYLPADHKGNFDFKLLRTKASDDYAIVAMADPQTANEKHFKLFCDNVMPDILETVSDETSRLNTVGIVLGDICWDRTDLLPGFKEQFARTGIPFYPVIGNHDHLRESKGDHETSSDYRSNFGPENYAFGIGSDYVIVLDNVIYDTQKQYRESYDDAQLEWLKGLLSHIPAESHIYICQHCPFITFKRQDFALTGKADEMLEILKGRKASFLTGHSHINNNLKVTDDIMEFNIAAACGSWWSTKHCNDGTPGGYKVFEKKDGKLSWWYKSVGCDKDFQVEVFAPGQSQLHPNAVIANVWDYDHAWSVEWWQDGKYMGKMDRAIDFSPEYIREIYSVYKVKKIPAYKTPRPNIHYFLAVPDQYASEVRVVVKDRFGRSWENTVRLRDCVDVQAHRGGAGLMPENTISSMKNAIDLGVNTLELDLQISADKQVVVSHDSYFHYRYATRPDGSIVKKEDPKEYIYTMDYSQVAKYDTGLRESTVWPEKACIPEHKPLASELISFVENYTRENKLTPMRYNIEIKCRAGKGEGTNWPEYKEFTDRCMELLLSMDLGDRLVVQCFDARALNYMHEKYPQVKLSFLIDKKDTDFEATMAKLNFTPDWISPQFSLVDKTFCEKAWARGMKIVPWTVDNEEDIRRMIDLKVEAIISNYPDRLLKLTRGYVNAQGLLETYPAVKNVVLPE